LAGCWRVPNSANRVCVRPEVRCVARRRGADLSGCRGLAWAGCELFLLRVRAIGSVTVSVASCLGRCWIVSGSSRSLVG
jgi:hypothetical protein